MFSALHDLARQNDIEINFFQIAETEKDRLGLSEVDKSYHRYPYTLVFRGAYEHVPSLKLISRLCQLIVASDAEVVVLAGYHRIEYWAQLVVAKITGKSVFVFCDSTKFDRPRYALKEAIKRALFRNFDGFFCYGERSRQYLQEYGIRAETIHERCQAAALPNSYYSEAALAERLQNISNGLKPTVIFVGRLSKEKNLPALIRSFRQVTEEVSDATLRIIGNGPDRGALTDFVRKLGLSQKVTFLGSKSGAELYAEYATAACLVLPSLSEPWGLVVNESLSFGCPVIVSDRCGCSCELVIEGKTGFVFPAEDEKFLSARIRQLLDSSFPQASAARECIHLISTFTPKTAASAIIAGLKTLDAL